MNSIKNLFIALSLTLLFLERKASGANILGLMGCSSPSVQLWNNVIINELARRGHNLTILAVDVPKMHPINVHYMHLEETYVSLYNDSDKYDIYELTTSGDFKQMILHYDYFIKACRGIIRSKGFQQLMDYPSDTKFDLVLYDILFGPCIIGFIHKFKYPPVIGLSAYKLDPTLVDHVGGHSHPGYIPIPFKAFDIYMNFWERLDNTWIYFLHYMFEQFYSIPLTEKIVRTRFARNMPPLLDLEKLTILVISNTHPSMDYPESIPPNVIEVAGLQINDPKPVSTEIEKFLNTSKIGAIYISMGTNVKSDLLGDKRINAIIQAIRWMPDYNFLWKFEQDSIKDKLPKNVLIQNWFSQNDILAHPKVKAFVTHAGSLSTQETIWHAKPMVVIPLFVDQPRNAHRAVTQGIAVKVDFITMNADDLYYAIRNVTEDPSYTINMQMRSKLFKDRPEKPLNTAMWWIEYVLRNPNPDHLKSPVLTLGYFRANSIDVFAFIGSIIVFIIFIFGFLLKRIIFSLIKSNASKKLAKNKKKN